MQPERRAVIDVGTNSVKLLVAEVAGGEVAALLEQSHQTRLGHGFYGSHCLQPARIRETAETVARFATTAREHAVATTRVIGTSAAREASNAAELVLSIDRACGLKMEILSGEQEADLAFRGVTTDPALANVPLLLLEVGGGSAQFILGHGQTRDFLHSFRIGSVRLLEKLPHSDPPKGSELSACREFLREFLQKEVGPNLLPAIEREKELCSSSAGVQFVATGGTASILGCMEAELDHFDRGVLEATRLSFARVRWNLEHLWGLSLEQRKQVVGLPKNRADVILTGAAIYEAVMQQFDFKSLRISTRGLRFGTILERSASL